MQFKSNLKTVVKKWLSCSKSAFITVMPVGQAAPIGIWGSSLASQCSSPRIPNHCRLAELPKAYNASYKHASTYEGKVPGVDGSYSSQLFRWVLRPESTPSEDCGNVQDVYCSGGWSNVVVYCRIISVLGPLPHKGCMQVRLFTNDLRINHHSESSMGCDDVRSPYSFSGRYIRFNLNCKSLLPKIVGQDADNEVMPLITWPVCAMALLQHVVQGFRYTTTCSTGTIPISTSRCSW